MDRAGFAGGLGEGTAPLDLGTAERESLLFSGTGRERRPRRWVIWTIQAVLLALFLTAWEQLVEAKVLDHFFFSQPSAIGLQLWQWFS